MPGFKRENVRREKEEVVELDDLDFNDEEFDDDDEDEEVGFGGSDKSSAKSKPKQIRRPSKNANVDTNKNKIVLFACGGVVILILGVVLYFTVFREKQKPPEPEPPKVVAPEAPVAPGAPNLNSDSVDKPSVPLVDQNQILKDLNGKTLPNNYKISRIETRKDFINYEKKRASTGDGLEFNWLEAVYKGKSYKVQVPIKYAKQMENKGITVVEIEVVILEDGSELITYMQLSKDAASLLE